MTHQPSSEAKGTALDMQIETNEVVRLYHDISKMYAEHTVQPVERIEQMLWR